jgi:hypothetical protein
MGNSVSPQMTAGYKTRATIEQLRRPSKSSGCFDIADRAEKRV